MRQLQCILLTSVRERTCSIARVRTHSFRVRFIILTQAILRNRLGVHRGETRRKASGENQGCTRGNGLTLQELLHDRREHRSQVFLAGQLLGDPSGSSVVSHDGGVQLQRAEESHFEVSLRDVLLERRQGSESSGQCSELQASRFWIPRCEFGGNSGYRRCRSFDSISRYVFTRE